MAFTVTVTAFQLSTTEDWTSSKFNQGFNPTVSVSGNLSALDDYNTLSNVSKAFTVTDLALGEITLASAHSLSAPTTVDEVRRARVSNSGGALPSGLTASSTYDYYVRPVGTDKFTLHTTPAGAIANNNRVELAGTGTGTHTIVWRNYSLGPALIRNETTSKWELGILQRDSLPEMLPASSTGAGARGAVPQPKVGQQGLFLRADGSWQTPTGDTGSNIFNYANHY